MKIICVGQNYREHIRELGGTIPDEPVIFLKPDTALLLPGKPFFIPEWSEDLQYEAEVIFRICRVGKYIAPKFAHKYYDAVSVGIDFTARDLQRKFKKQGLPWECCKGFDGSAALGGWVPKEELPDPDNLHFELLKNGETVQSGCTADMIFKLDEIIAYASRFFTLKIGDIIYTGTPVGVGSVRPEDRLVGKIEGREVLSVKIK